MNPAGLQLTLHRIREAAKLPRQIKMDGRVGVDYTHSSRDFPPKFPYAPVCNVLKTPNSVKQISTEPPKEL